jgi:hypothetical protein
MRITITAAVLAIALSTAAQAGKPDTIFTLNARRSRGHTTWDIGGRI